MVKAEVESQSAITGFCHRASQPSSPWRRRWEERSSAGNLREVRGEALGVDPTFRQEEFPGLAFPQSISLVASESLAIPDVVIT
jgi:hypothetical protein